MLFFNCKVKRWRCCEGVFTAIIDLSEIFVASLWAIRVGTSDEKYRIYRVTFKILTPAVLPRGMKGYIFTTNSPSHKKKPFGGSPRGFLLLNTFGPDIPKPFLLRNLLPYPCRLYTEDNRLFLF